MTQLRRLLFGSHTTAVLAGGAVLMIVLLWLFTALRLWQDKQFVEDQARLNLQNIAVSFKEHSMASIRNTDEALRIIKYHYEASGNKDFELLNGYFEQGAIDVSFLNQVGIINAEGIYEFSNLKSHKKVDLSDREHFRVHRDGYPYTLFISKPVIGRASGKWSIQLTRRLENKDGSFKGVAVASFDPNFFADYYRKIDLGPDSLTALIGVDGLPRMLRVGDQTLLSESTPRIALPDVATNATSGSFVSDQLFDRTQRLYVFEKLTHQPLLVLVGMRESEVLSEYTRLEHSWLLSSSVLTALIVLFVGIAIHYIRRSEKINAELRESYRVLDEAKQHELDMSNRLTQSEKLAALGQLAAGVAHEINNPMGFVASNINTLRKYADVLQQAMQATHRQQRGEITFDELQALEKRLNINFVLSDLRTMLNETEEGVVRVKHIVSDLKNFARADSQRDWVQADLRQGIQSTLNIVNHEVKYRADVQLNLGELPPIECIPSQINQVFLNLIVNAAQAMPEGRRGTIEVRGCVDGDTVCVEVEDDGDGIAPENINRIFEPFYTTKGTGSGTGLGLSVSLGIVQRHQGSLTVRSEPGRGTCFRVCLPIHQTPKPTA